MNLPFSLLSRAALLFLFLALGLSLSSCSPQPPKEPRSCQTHSDCPSPAICLTHLGLCSPSQFLESVSLDASLPESPEDAPPTDLRPDTLPPDAEPCSQSAPRDCYTGPAGTQGVGLCKSGFQTCTNGFFGPCVGAITPAPEICNGEDDDCDGRTDEDLPTCCLPGDSRNCYTGPLRTEGIGLCTSGTQTCRHDRTWGVCSGEITPKRELCNDKDDDCNGSTDDGIHCQCVIGETRPCYTGPLGTNGVGTCKGGEQICNESGSWEPCTREITPQPEDCNNRKDDDCDGRIDNCIPLHQLCKKDQNLCAGKALCLSVEDEFRCYQPCTDDSSCSTNTDGRKSCIPLGFDPKGFLQKACVALRAEHDTCDPKRAQICKENEKLSCVSSTCKKGFSAATGDLCDQNKSCGLLDRCVDSGTGFRKICLPRCLLGFPCGNGKCEKDKFLDTGFCRSRCNPAQGTFCSTNEFCAPPEPLTSSDRFCSASQILGPKPYGALCDLNSPLQTGCDSSFCLTSSNSTKGICTKPCSTSNDCPVISGKTATCSSSPTTAKEWSFCILSCTPGTCPAGLFCASRPSVSLNYCTQNP